MSEEIQTTPLQTAFREARRAAGKEAVHLTLVAHGSATGMLEDVPSARRDACLLALRKLASGGGVDASTKTNAALGDIHRQAYGERPTPARSLDEKAIWNRFNNPPPVKRD